MRRFAALTSALALGVACAVLLASCGGSGGTLSSARSAEINSLLDQIDQLANAGDCEGAGSLSQKVAQTIQARSDIDSSLRNALVDGLERIQALSNDPSFCGGAADTTSSTTDTGTTDTETTNSDTTTSGVDTTPDVITTPTQPTTPTQTTPTNGGGTGGLGSGGVGPGQ